MKEHIDKGKRSLEELLRQKAYDEVIEALQKEGIDPTVVKDEDIETLVEAKVSEKKSTLKGVAIGGAIAVALHFLLGI